MHPRVTEEFVLLLVGIVVVVARLYVRVKSVGWKKLKPDDWLMVAAAIGYVAGAGLAYAALRYWKGLANSGMTEAQRQLLDPNSDEYILRVNGSKTHVAGLQSYCFVLWTVKASVCSFYLRLLDSLWFRRRILFSLFLVAATWVTIYPDPGERCYPTDSRLDILTVLILNITTDIYIMCIPVPVLLRCSFGLWKKIGLVLLFSGGVFVSAAAVLRSVLVLTDSVNGGQVSASWAVRETFVAIITSNMPFMVPLLRTCTRPFRERLRRPGAVLGEEAAPPRRHPALDALKFHENNLGQGQGGGRVFAVAGFTLDDSGECIHLEHVEPNASGHVRAETSARGDAERGSTGGKPGWGHQDVVVAGVRS
ncbi:hypothetical protein B0T14DRAFT_275160 [Immersiella caudata]|uniref:Rhodopsin domain-containing protein n=1 Tax=Immersiella caudata TaxID=314043 RepID=A0AA40BY09_9PEZI|nr:hypothetical protein B0T14DRAFT_275160 [Immersiella caudata]